ncbi:MAG: archaeal heat shock protein Hsp14 [Nitrosopumilus sp.]|uniref:Hsp20/alpha crystallin family protein n=2 Tax=Candidatus Nitrosomaritimum aestuariumsis TaxID=3342354 RepID=A0AC60VWP5_9ARCH|nr:Hsp20/alpha crystallin family protein [Nitrosopumilaceae archaeon]MBA4461291.1 Hsp20/alpha crystallin family protein [Nitrosopumilaceae archaeon]
MGLVKSMANEMMKEIGNKSREFYEFVLPPVDMHLDDEKLTVLIDLPGFEKKDIRLSLDENILSIQACKEEVEESHHMICNQRPNVIDKKIRLPVDVNDEDDAVSSAKYSQGVLTIIIPVHKHGKEIKVE